MPYISKNADEKFSEEFQFANGDNRLTSSVEALTSEKEFQQSTAVVINGDKYSFNVKYMWDKDNVKATITFDDTCSNTWETTTLAPVSG